MIIFSGWGYRYETRQGDAERMFASGRYFQAMSAVKRILKDDPDNMAAVKLQRELKDVARGLSRKAAMDAAQRTLHRRSPNFDVTAFLGLNLYYI